MYKVVVGQKVIGTVDKYDKNTVIIINGQAYVAITIDEEMGELLCMRTSYKIVQGQEHDGAIPVRYIAIEDGQPARVVELEGDSIGRDKIIELEGQLYSTKFLRNDGTNIHIRISPIRATKGEVVRTLKTLGNNIPGKLV